ncbi:hypothetical protein [Halopenitus sp. POP-27]|nr:hypothetical protein [Halopenitus sp. POP-27]
MTVEENAVVDTLRRLRDAVENGFEVLTDRRRREASGDGGGGPRSR